MTVSSQRAAYYKLNVSEIYAFCGVAEAVWLSFTSSSANSINAGQDSVYWTAADVLGETIDAAGENQYF
jgi:hypothetical protein